MSDMEKSYSFHSVNFPVNHVITIECFVNESCTSRETVILLCVIIHLIEETLTLEKHKP